MEPLFNPPLHRQRHQFVVDFVKRNKPRKVLDLGCCECSLLKRLKFHREVHLLVGLDIDGTKVKKKMHELAPLSTDYLQPSYDQLCIELYEGSVTERDARLRGFDLVTSIELIEHLTPADVKRFSEVVFGYMTPAAAIVSTPNCEYNPLLPGLRGFRHSDHKFEWSRAEFKSWALKVCSQFGYEVEFTGVGQPASGYQESVGFCSQIGVFRRLERGDDRNTLGGADAEEVYSYKLLCSINYPSLCDNNILRRVLVSEVLFGAEKLKSRWMEKKSGEGKASYAPIETEEGEEKHTGGYTRGASEDQEEEDEGVCWTHFQSRQDSCTSLRCVSVPLDVLWSCCPRVSTLSGSLGNLRRLLMDEPDVELTQDGDAVLVTCHEQDLDEEEAQDDLEDSGYEQASRLHSAAAEQEDNWEASV
ncbi:small RNA 2'-O-methyltransferase [Pleuronectes platessa]|uniref:small RNA 2'-O-methyltransferase n=1 Tax=Pleuronectes platessa TaxID=8262 RepID=UPI00232A47E2|nr:small RNA 2'-O-methyltransferase [Pleuronectes platessa]